MTSGQLAGPPALGEATVQELRDALRGTLVSPGDVAYNEARSVWNGMIDRRPALIARCAGTSDVIAAVGFARSEGLAVAVRGGGHNVAGNATCDGGLVIDLSPMKGVHVDPEARTVRAAGRCDVGRARPRRRRRSAWRRPAASSPRPGSQASRSAAGSAGSCAKHGLACDNLISADVVTADGQTVRASETENAELLWGLRGGGGNFGVVAEFEFRAAPRVAGAGRAARLAGRRGGGVLRFWRDWVARHARTSCARWPRSRTHRPSRSSRSKCGAHRSLRSPAFTSTPRAALRTTCRRSRDQNPALDVVGPMPYTAIQGMFDAGVPRGSRNYWRSGYVDVLSDEAIDAILAHADAVPAPLGQLHVHQLGGALSRVPAGDNRVRQPRRSVPHQLHGAVARSS